MAARSESTGGYLRVDTDHRPRDCRILTQPAGPPQAVVVSAAETRLSLPHPTIDSSHVEARADDDGGLHGLLISLGFWFCLFCAATGYAAATLTPQYVENQRLWLRFAEGEAELRQLAHQVDRYQKYCDDLARTTKLTRVDDPALHTVSVDPALQFRLDALPTSETGDTASHAVPAWVEWLSGRVFVRHLLLAASASLLLGSFILMVDSDIPRSPQPKLRARLRSPVRQRLSSLRGRYRAATNPLDS